MKIEQEALDYKLAKLQKFTHQLREYAAYLEKYIEDNLYDSHEVENAKRNLQACVLWAEEASKEHGTK